MIDFLLKPFTDDELLDAVQRAIVRDGERRAARAALTDLEQRAARLTAREWEVCTLVVAGRLNRQIAAALGTSEKTVKVHRSRVMAKFQASSLAELVRASSLAELVRIVERLRGSRTNDVRVPPTSPALNSLNGRPL